MNQLAAAFTLALVAAIPGRAAAAADWVAAVSVRQTPRISAYASVESGAPGTIVADRAGTIADLTVLPGDSVAAGQAIVRLTGPRIVADSARAEAALTNAQTAQRVAQRALAIEQRKRQQNLSTDEAVDQAAGALAAAAEQQAIATADLGFLRATADLRAVSAGVVQRVAVANGDTVTAGQVVATIQPATGSWIKADLYGKSLPAGTTGVFTPDDGGAPVAVSLRGPLGTALPSGGVPVALVPARELPPGLFGTVTLDLPPRLVTLVPNEALILDKGHWWAMVRTEEGDRAVQVTPGPAMGYETVIEAGVLPGQHVVVTNAYLLYHRGVAALFHPPD